MMRIAKEAARAKINLSLELLGRRPDGYHELRSIVQELELCDDVEVMVSNGGAASAIPPECDLAIVPDGVDISLIGPPEKNLCIRAVRAFFSHLPEEATFRRKAGAVSVRVIKRIPLGGGLGGGSADAAAILRALERLTGSDGFGEKRLKEIGAELGSDVPALVLGGTVLMEGRGEEASRLPPAPGPAHVVLANCGVHVSTAAAYAEADRRMAEHCHAAGVYPTELRNDLEAPVFAMHPEVAATAQMLKEAGAKTVLMSGSGATVFALAETAVEAERIASRVPSGCWVRTTSFRMGAPS